jgi:hypothetical protein
MAAETSQPTNWNIPQKLAFRFFMLFFVTYVILEPNGVIPGSDTAYSLYVEPIKLLVIWMGKHVLHLPKPVAYIQTGSGDTTFDYLLMLLNVVVAAAGMMIWSALDWKRANYNKLLYWLCTIVRYYVAVTMVTYGGIKVVKLQFPDPSLGRLLQPLGNFSPMGLEWNYMGFSKGFNYVTGFAELSCGLLLLFRRTTTLGAILGIVVAGNVMAVNYCYDVPVKLLSTMLVVMCLFLMLQQFTRLLNFFILNKETPPANIAAPKFKARWKNIVLIVVKYILVAYVVIGYLINDIQAGQSNGDESPKTPLFGIYNVQSFVRNKDTIAPLKTDTTRWDKLIVNNYTNHAQVQLMTDSMKYYFFKADTVKHTIMMNLFADTVHKYQFTYTRVKPDILLLKGKWKNDSLHIRFKRFDERNFRLLKRGFHWINEIPYNR